MREIRALVITSVNNQPVRVEDVVEGGGWLPVSARARRESLSVTRPAWGRWRISRWRTATNLSFRRTIP